MKEREYHRFLLPFLINLSMFSVHVESSGFPSHGCWSYDILMKSGDLIVTCGIILRSYLVCIHILILCLVFMWNHLRECLNCALLVLMLFNFPLKMTIPIFYSILYFFPTWNQTSLTLTNFIISCYGMTNMVVL